MCAYATQPKKQKYAQRRAGDGENHHPPITPPPPPPSLPLAPTHLQGLAQNRSESEKRAFRLVSTRGEKRGKESGLGRGRSTLSTVQGQAGRGRGVLRGESGGQCEGGDKAHPHLKVFCAYCSQPCCVNIIQLQPPAYCVHGIVLAKHKNLRAARLVRSIGPTAIRLGRSLERWRQGAARVFAQAERGECCAQCSDSSHAHKGERGDIKRAVPCIFKEASTPNHSFASYQGLGNFVLDLQPPRIRYAANVARNDGPRRRPRHVFPVK